MVAFEANVKGLGAGVNTAVGTGLRLIEMIGFLGVLLFEVRDGEGGGIRDGAGACINGLETVVLPTFL